MRIAPAIATVMLLGVPVFAQDAGVTDAGALFVPSVPAVTDVQGLRDLVDSSFGGGRYYRVERSDFWIVDLHPTSGMPSTELYVYQGAGPRLRLRAYLPIKHHHTRKAELRDGMLIVTERSDDTGESEVVVMLSE